MQLPNMVNVDTVAKADGIAPMEAAPRIAEGKRSIAYSGTNADRYSKDELPIKYFLHDEYCNNRRQQGNRKSNC